MGYIFMRVPDAGDDLLEGDLISFICEWLVGMGMEAWNIGQVHEVVIDA